VLGRRVDAATLVATFSAGPPPPERRWGGVNLSFGDDDFDY